MTASGPPSQSSDKETPTSPEFRRVFEEEFGYVWNTVRRLGAREADIEDLVHDVFLTFHRRLADFDPKRPIKPWLFGIAYRVVSDYRRLGRNQRELLTHDGGSADKPDSRRGAEDEAARAEDRELLAAALLEVPEDRRAVLLLHDLDGVSMPEIAAVLSIPLNTGYSRLRLARRDLKEAILKRKGGNA